MRHPIEHGPVRRPARGFRTVYRPAIERLERREVPANIAVDPTQVLRSADPDILGVNLAWWDATLTTDRTKQMVRDAGLTLFRFPGGSSSDEYHFTDPPPWNGYNTAAAFAQFIESVDGAGMVTLNYGTGSPQEGAAFLAYLNGSVGNTTPIGVGPRWSDAQNRWVDVDWKTADDWARLRASAPLAQDDGLNFLRIHHPAPFGFRYFEIGNEVYGSWETDRHAVPHDPATYATFARRFEILADAIDPTIAIGIATGSVGQENGWTRNVLTLGAAQGFVPGFLSDHHYMQGPGGENDQNLLLNTVSGTGPQDPTNPMSWTARASGYRALLQQTLGTAANGVELLATEFNSVYTAPGKQTTSLVNGLFIADSLGSLLTTSYDGANVWDLRNSYETGNNNSSNLYGWRQGGDYGLIGSSNGAAPSSGAYTPYPSYFAEQLVAMMVHAGDSVVPATSNDPYLATYAVKQVDGNIKLLVINKSATNDITGTFQINGVNAGTQATAWRYGKAEDTAQSLTTDGRSSLTSFLAALTPTGGGFSALFPSYSMTLLDIAGAPAPPNNAPTVATAPAASPATVVGTTTVLSVLGADDGGEAALRYAWLVAGTPPAGVTFSANGTNAAQATTVTFAAAGTYDFVVSITDAAGLSVASGVTVIVNQSLSAIVVTPGSASLTTGATRAFAAQANDQFGRALATQPAVSWTVAGAGTINAGGVYTAPAAPGTATVRAAAGNVLGTASVTVTSPAASGVTVAYRTTSDWGTGLVGEISLTNTGTAAVSGWTLQFDTSYALTQIWNATIVSHVGNRYNVRNADWNATIAPGQTVRFGFVANRNGTSLDPSAFVVNGQAIGSPPPSQDTFDVAASYRVTNDWRSGFTGEVTLRNTGTQPIVGWTIAFDFAANLTQIWNATIVSRVGNRYTIRDAGWNSTLAPGASISFGFVAARADGLIGPAIGMMTDVIVTTRDKSRRFAAIGSNG